MEEEQEEGQGMTRPKTWGDLCLEDKLRLITRASILIPLWVLVVSLVAYRVVWGFP